MPHRGLNRSRSHRRWTYRNRRRSHVSGPDLYHYRYLRLNHHLHYCLDTAKQSSGHQPDQRNHYYGRWPRHWYDRSYTRRSGCRCHRQIPAAYLSRLLHRRRRRSYDRSRRYRSGQNLNQQRPDELQNLRLHLQQYWP